MIFTTEEMRNGKGSPWVGLEIIPSGFEENSIMDAFEKLALREYVFYNGFPARPISHSSEMLSTIREKLQTLEPAIEPEVLQGHWSQKLSHHEEALYENLRYTRNYLAQMGALVVGEMPPLPSISKTVHEMQIDLDLCAFCNSKVINKQIVCVWKDIQILMGHKPCSPYGNFLILPKRHQCAWDLTREEAIASFEAVIALKTMFLEKTGLSNWICYIQDGPAVGQTVPHTHIHFFILPDPLKSFVTDMQHIHNQRPVLSYEEMRACCEI
jgi:diadenosine tetraphosphate (Ap4A) HIT family hydrolase